jgi:hypothetical protein
MPLVEYNYQNLAGDSSQGQTQTQILTHARKRYQIKSNQILTAPAKKSVVNCRFLNRPLFSMSEPLATRIQGSDEPFNESSSLDREALLDQPRSREACGKRDQANDSESPFWAKRDDQAVYCERDDSAT